MLVTEVQTACGEQLDEADVRAVAAVMDELAVNIPWQKGDLMLLDNRRAMHARRPFAPPRRVLAYICE
jgi:alpha-ketoglutarate-dependent taurine dioxygenase